MADFFDELTSSVNQKVDEEYKKKLEEKESSEIVKFDIMKLYFGEDYKVNEYITVKQPTIGDILEFGEDKLFASISPFTGNPTTYRVQLWDAGIDWNELSNYDLFLLLYKTLTPDITELVFGGFDFADLEAFRDKTTDQVGLRLVTRDDDGYIISVGEEVINEFSYSVMSEYLRTMFNQHPKNQFAKGKTTKRMIIEKEKREMKQRVIDDKNSSSYLMPLISSCVNHPGFKYKKNELREVGYVEFMDSVKRLGIYEQSTAFLKGMYSGMMDTSKMSSEQLNDNVNWMRDLYIK